jgi:dTDP-4-dehydrorhamnose reductase
MRILVTGAQGQLGRELQVTLADHEVVPFDLPEFDLLSAHAEQRIINAHPQTIIHAAAYTDVEGAEQEPEKARAINVEGTAKVARAAARTGARLMVLSTDYVFDGRKRRPYLESDAPNPLGVYARTKWEAERLALSLCSNTLVVRTAWLYGRHGKNFVKTILRLAQERPELRVVSDQRGSPTYAGDLAQAVMKIVQTDLSGVVHAVGEGDCTWHEFASAIVSLAGLSTPVRPITTAEANLRAPRPPYTVLANHRLAQLGIVLPHWKDALTRFVEQVEAKAEVE